ncbi:OsmC family protein [Kamptonema cortianum]|nr:OsmC family protein [Geitlerinema splendidum]MDK3161039.1 OsmC family protein [Kamptonema cortianum]
MRFNLMNMMNIQWKGGLAFEATGENSGYTFTLDSLPETGGQGLGPTPVEALLASLAACAAMDVVSILQKKRQEVKEYRIEVESKRSEPGEWPRPVTDVTIRHIISGVNLDPTAVQRSVELSEEKYCTVLATLRQNPNVKSTIEITETVAS